MAVEYTITIKRDGMSVNWAHVAQLFDSVGWHGREPQELRDAFASSMVVRFAYDPGGQLVGVCRAITDGAWYALVVDLVIAPESQRRGVGRQLLASVCDDLRDVRQIHLVSTRGNEAFYDKAGFDRQPLQAFFRLNRRTQPQSGAAT